ncbi:hypothetical protein BC826DRAFT_1103861 [Russula brevipes]|nr:hypothetical protein BC826DRAFT_1103861 [Russula brevipes]
MAIPRPSSHLRPVPFNRASTYSTSSKRNSDFFRSGLPSDPFSNAVFRKRDPVILDSGRLFLTTTTSQPLRDVILVLGDPTPQDVAPLLNSERLASSLLILVSHKPPPIPPGVQPAVTILRLEEPLALEQEGAVRLVNVLEWAERVARIWRKVGGNGVKEIAECDQDDFGTLALPPNTRRRYSETHPPSPASSTSRLSSINSTLRGLRGHRALPPPDPSQRSFDALLNYLPSHISDKALLRLTILVTTVSQPFLIPATPRATRSPQASQPPSPTRNSFLKRISVYSVTTPPANSELSLNSFTAGSPPFSQGPPIKAHLVHLLPARPRNSVANRVLHSIETFLLSFSFPISLGMGAQKPGMSELPRTCLLEAAAFSEPVAAPSGLLGTTAAATWSIAEVLLSGCLDDEPIPRVWLSGASDIVISASPESRLPPASTAAAVHAAAANPRLSSSSAPSPVPSADLGPNGQRMQAVSLDDSSCHAGLIKETTTMPTRGKRSWLWKFWKRRIVMAPMSR